MTEPSLLTNSARKNANRTLTVVLSGNPNSGKSMKPTFKRFSSIFPKVPLVQKVIYEFAFINLVLVVLKTTSSTSVELIKIPTQQ